MRSTKQYNIAIIFPDWYHFLNDVIEGILQIRGIRHHCQFRNFILSDFNEPVEFPHGYQPDGILVSYDAENFNSTWLEDYDVPVINIFASEHGDKFPTVGTCQKSLAQLIVAHFETLEFQTIGMIGTTQQTLNSRFYQAFDKECHLKKIPFWYMEIPDGISAGCWPQLEKHAPELKDKLLHSKSRTGIYSCHDMRGRLIADYCTELGIQVPEKVGILGRFNSINARLCTPELSSVVIPGKEVGAKAIQMLVQLIDGAPVDELFPQVKVTEIRVRESTVGNSSPDIIALQARTIIRENACNGLTVDELIQSLPVARSTFEKRYLALTGSTPAAEIRKIRIDKARQLLINTNKTIDEIAFDIGFSDPRPFVVFFKREVHQTPGNFRLSYMRTK